MVRVFYVSVSGKRTNVFPVAPLHIKHFPDFIRSLGTMVFIQNALNGNRDTPHILRLLVAV